MAIQVKICGLIRPDAVDAVLKHGAAYFGFVFHPASPRHLTSETAGALLERLTSERHKDTVAVTVNPDDVLLETILKLPFGYIQLHGNESPARVLAIKARFGKPIIKAFSVSSAEDLDAAALYQDTADMFLFDAKSTNPAMPGGTGTSFDWSLMRSLKTNKPWFLSGGISLANMDEALEESGAKMLDLSSSLESSPGIKDVTKIVAFLDHAEAKR
ncbi:MAG: phosphoribosylanthranilate isomerase [Rickettsiales bacterium]